MALNSTSLDAMAARSPATPRIKSLCAFLKKCNGPHDTVEAIIRANCREKLYKNRDLIDEAAKVCSPARVARWRSLYPDKR